MRLSLALPLLCLLTACTGSSTGGGAAPSPQPSPEAFRDGPCRIAADAVLDIGVQAGRLGDDPKPPVEVRDALRDDQARLVGLRAGLDPALAPRFEALITAIGLVRLQADGNSYQPATGKTLVKAYDALVDACTT